MCLPPLRGIEHPIDFIFGAQILNRPAYRSNPEDLKELQRQVDKLISKGLIRESMSPYVIKSKKGKAIVQNSNQKYEG